MSPRGDQVPSAISTSAAAVQPPPRRLVTPVCRVPNRPRPVPWAVRREVDLEAEGVSHAVEHGPPVGEEVVVADEQPGDAAGDPLCAGVEVDPGAQVAKPVLPRLGVAGLGAVVGRAAGDHLRRVPDHGEQARGRADLARCPSTGGAPRSRVGLDHHLRRGGVRVGEPRPQLVAIGRPDGVRQRAKPSGRASVGVTSARPATVDGTRWARWIRRIPRGWTRWAEDGLRDVEPEGWSVPPSWCPAGAAGDHHEAASGGVSVTGQGYGLGGPVRPLTGTAQRGARARLPSRR